MTLNGAFLTACGLVSLLAWLRLGYPAALPAAVACLVPIGAGLPWRLSRRAPLILHLSSARPTVERGEHLRLGVSAEIAGMARRLPLFVDVRLRSADGVSERAVQVAMHTGQIADILFEGLPRGEYVASVASVIATNATGLWRRTMAQDQATLHLTVLPRRIELGRPPDIPNPEEDGFPALLGIGVGASFAALREYVPGDDVRHIDWAASARATDDTVYVRQFVPSWDTRLLIVLDPAAPASPAGVEAFEVAVDLAYSLIRAAGTENGIGFCCAGDTRIRQTPADAQDRLLTLRSQPQKPGAGRHPVPVPGLAARNHTMPSVIVTAADDGPFCFPSAEIVFHMRPPGIRGTGGSTERVVEVTSLAEAGAAWARLRG